MSVSIAGTKLGGAAWWALNRVCAKLLFVVISYYIYNMNSSGGELQLVPSTPTQREKSSWTPKHNAVANETVINRVRGKRLVLIVCYNLS